METRSNYAIVGAVVVALVVAMFVAVLWLARFSGADDQRFDIFFKQSITGLAVGSPVAFNGVPVGKIEEIRLLPATPQFVRVRIALAEDVPVLKGTTAAVESIGFTGVGQISLTGAMQGADPITARGPYGVPVIPPRVGGFASLLESAPELLDNVSQLTERLTQLLDKDNQRSLANILGNVDRVSGALADRAPEIAATVVEAQATLHAASATLRRVDALAGSTQQLLDRDGKPMVADLRRAIGAAEASLARIDTLTATAQPGLETLSTETLPEANRLVRDLRDLTDSLGQFSDRLNNDGALGVLGPEKLPEYKPGKTK